MGTAGFARGLTVVDLDEVVVLGPPSERPRREWHGEQADLIDLLGRLEDGAGVDAFWTLLDA